MVFNMVISRRIGLLLLGCLMTTSAAIFDCNQNFTESVGQISSPSLSLSPHLQNIICRYRISAPSGKHIQLNFLPHPDMTDTIGCHSSSLRVFESENPNLLLDAPSAQYCDSKLACYKTYLSNESSLLLVYTSLYFPNSFRFKLNYKIISGFNMVFNNTEGMLYSPNFINKLLNRLQVYTYRIEANPGMKIFLYFSYMNLRNDPSCTSMSLSILEGANSSGVPAEKRCGRSSHQFTSATNIVTLKFENNVNAAMVPEDYGFHIYYVSGNDGCNKSFRAGSGTATTPLYPNNYPNNTICTYTITAEKGSMIYVEPKSYFLRTGDTIQFFERDALSGHLVQKMFITPQLPYYSTSYSLMYRLTSNSPNTNSHGIHSFAFKYLATKGCNITLTASPSYLSSPSFPYPYPTNVVCNYTFYLRPTENSFPAIQIGTFDIKDSHLCGEASFSIYEKSNGMLLLLDTLCGRKSRRSYMIAGDSLFIQFKSTSGSSGRGFFAIVSLFPVVERRNFVSSSGSGSLPWRLIGLQCNEIKCNRTYPFSATISSPNYPYKYPHMVSCKNIVTNSYGSIILRMQHFDLESSENCKKDSLKIFEGSVANATLISTRCGNDATEYISQSSPLTLLFSSDSTIAQTGYRINVTLCGGAYYYFSTSAQQVIQSPWYPDSYSNNLLCRYLVFGRFLDFGVRLVFNTFELESSHECQNDSVTVYEGTITSANIAAVKCGSVTGDFISKSRSILVVFRSNSHLNSTGFSITVEYCSKLFTDENGTVTSPKFGLYSNPSMPFNCSYAIRLQKGAKVQLIFQNFSLSSYGSGSHLKLYDGRDSSARLVATMNASSYHNFLSTGNEVFMQYISHVQDIFDRTLYGFKIKYFTYKGFCLKHKPCKNSATCIDLSEDNYRCNCSIEYTGTNCSEKIIPCNSSPCLNNGTCSNIYSNQPPTFNCTCQDHYFGNTCKEHVGYCIEHRPCKNNATCTAFSDKSYICNCSIDYTGINCSEKIIPCSSNPCLNNGTCSNIYNNQSPSFICTCSDHYIGSKCEEYVGYCIEHEPCKNNATCTVISGKNYICNCSMGYTGANCSEKIIPCNSSPCFNNGTCLSIYSNQRPTFNCSCPDEYTGDLCEQFIDPCLNYITKDEWQRSNQSMFDSSSMSPICDLSMATAWYRFTSKAGGAVPSSCPAVNSCGTMYPIWADGSLPSAPGSSKALTACVRSNNSCCSEQWPIHVRKCSANGTDFYLYRLPPPPRCPMSYCAGSEIPCPNGLSSRTGFTPCSYKIPQIKHNPVLSVSHGNSRIIFACKYNVDQNEQAFDAEVTWFQEHLNKELYQENFRPWRGRALLQNNEGSAPIFRLGTTIYCKIRGWYGTFQGIASKYYESNRLFAGILIAPHATRHRITEGGPPLKINLTSTVPIVCPGSNDCKIQVQLIHDTTEILLTACSSIFRNGSSFHTIEVHAKRDFIDDGNKVATIKITVVNGSNALDWNNHLAINDIKVDVIDVGTARCSSNGDPRLLTFDNLYYSHFQPGDHVFVKSLVRSFEVHVRTWQCGSATCNCGIAVREGDDVIIVDMCFDGIPRLRFASKQTPSEGTIVKRDPTGKSFVIKFSSGAFVRVDNFRWSGGGFANFIVQVPSDDFGSTRGLCGNFDHTSMNDMLSKNGVQYDHLHYHGLTAPLGFSESWKLPIRQSLFYHRVLKRDCHQKAQNNYCDCKRMPGEMKGVKCIAHKRLSQPPEFQEIGWKEIRYGGSSCKTRKRRSTENVIILPEENDAVDYVYDPKPLPNVTTDWPTKSGKTEAQVTDYCNKTVKDSAPGKICAKISNFNFTSFLLQCIDDIKITDNYAFSLAAVRAMQDACEEVFLKNTSYWQKDPTNNGSLGPPKEMADTLCPGLCSGQGRCYKGRCICDSNYTSADCSVDKTKGPTVVSIFGNGTCDIRNRSDCHLARISGHDFIDSDALTCLAAKVNDNAKRSKNESMHRSYLLSFLEVLCDFRQHPVSIIGSPFRNKSFAYALYEIQVSNDRKVFSKEKAPYIIYDSKCMECNSRALTCSQKPNTCSINGYCFERDEKYASDPCFVCKPSLSTTEFISNCQSKSPTDETKSDVAMIISVTVGVFLFIVLIAGVVVVVRRRSKGKMPVREEFNMAKASFDNQSYAEM